MQILLKMILEVIKEKGWVDGKKKKNILQAGLNPDLYKFGKRKNALAHLSQWRVPPKSEDKRRSSGSIQLVWLREDGLVRKTECNLVL